MEGESIFLFANDPYIDAQAILDLKVQKMNHKTK